MTLFCQMIVCVLVRSTLCYTDTDDFTFNIAKHIKPTYECMKIPFNYTVPLSYGSVSYKKVWFYEVNGKKEDLSLSQNTNLNVLELPLLPPGQHRIGLRLEWENMRHTFQETIVTIVAALTKRPYLRSTGNLTEGHPDTLKCTAPYLECKEKPNITWVGASVTHAPSSTEGMSSTVKISPKAEDHNSNVTCKLQYRYALTEQTITLEVKYSPKILRISNCTLKDNKAFCRCVSQGNPRPTINWILPCGTYQSEYASSDSETVEEIVHVLGPYYSNSTIQCVSRNNLGTANITLKTQHPKSLTNLREELKNIAMEGQKITSPVPWIITGVFMGLTLAMFIIVIYQYKKAHKKKCNEEVNMYASLRKPSAELEYSVIPAQHNNLI